MNIRYFFGLSGDRVICCEAWRSIITITEFCLFLWQINPAPKVTCSRNRFDIVLPSTPELYLWTIPVHISRVFRNSETFIIFPELYPYSFQLIFVTLRTVLVLSLCMTNKFLEQLTTLYQSVLTETLAGMQTTWRQTWCPVSFFFFSTPQITHWVCRRRFQSAVTHTTCAQISERSMVSLTLPTAGG